MWWIIPAVIAALLVIYLLAIRCRGSKKGELAELAKYDYAHRGFHGGGVPENSMAAFRAAKEKGYGIELDIHLLSDGGLAVMHDSALKRTTGAEGRIEDLTVGELANYRLEGTEETIPLFSNVLALFEGAAPLIVELKAEGNQAELARVACDMLDKYDVKYCIESFDPRCIRWLKKNRPDVIRGQLASNFIKSKEKFPFVLNFAMTHNLLNFLSVPDFISYKFEDRKDTLSNFLCQKIWRARMAGWTIRDKDTQVAVKKRGWISIFEKFEP